MERKNTDKVKEYARVRYDKMKNDPERMKMRKEYEWQYNLNRKEQKR